jgi:branched-chain amino acid transport system ATP-binding protein
VMVLDFGRRISLGTPEYVQRDPEVIRAYLGEGDGGPTLEDQAAEAEALAATEEVTP